VPQARGGAGGDADWMVGRPVGLDFSDEASGSSRRQVGTPGTGRAETAAVLWCTRHAATIRDSPHAHRADAAAPPVQPPIGWSVAATCVLAACERTQLLELHQRIAALGLWRWSCCRVCGACGRYPALAARPLRWRGAGVAADPMVGSSDLLFAACERTQLLELHRQIAALGLWQRSCCRVCGMQPLS